MAVYASFTAIFALNTASMTYSFLFTNSSMKVLNHNGTNSVDKLHAGATIEQYPFFINFLIIECTAVS